MQRLFASLALCATVTFASAQDDDFYPQDTEAMLTNAQKHVDLVDTEVALTAEQKPLVKEAYMQLEREIVAVNYRFSHSGHTEEERASEMAAQWVAMEKAVKRRLKEVLTGTQMAKWEEATK